MSCGLQRNEREREIYARRMQRNALSKKKVVPTPNRFIRGSIDHLPSLSTTEACTYAVSLPYALPHAYSQHGMTYTCLLAPTHNTMPCQAGEINHTSSTSSTVVACASRPQYTCLVKGILTSKPAPFLVVYEDYSWPPEDIRSVKVTAAHGVDSPLRVYIP